MRLKLKCLAYRNADVCISFPQNTIQLKLQECQYGLWNVTVDVGQVLQHLSWSSSFENEWYSQQSAVPFLDMWNLFENIWYKWFISFYAYSIQNGFGKRHSECLCYKIWILNYTYTVRIWNVLGSIFRWHKYSSRIQWQTYWKKLRQLWTFYSFTNKIHLMYRMTHLEKDPN